MAGGLAGALMFISTMMVLIVLGAIILIKLVHAFQVVVAGTAAGAENLSWPDEPFFDVIPGIFPFLFVVALWVVPTHLTLLSVAKHRTPPQVAAEAAAPAEETTGPRKPPLRVWLPVAGDLAVLWLVLPVSLLSSFSATSQWVPLRAAMVAQLVRSAPAFVFYYPLAAVCLAVGAGAVWLLLFSGQPLYILAAAPVLAAAWLIAARLLGRLAALLRPAPDEDDEPDPRPRTKGERRRARSTVTDPWALPPPTDEEQYLTTRVPQEEAYDIQPAPAPAPPPRPRRPRHAPAATPSEETTPYVVESAPTEPEGEAARPGRPVPEPRREVEPAKLESLWTGVVGFPWRAGSVGTWLWLAVGLGAWAFLFQLALSLKPG
jgi:hypothetical protein